MHAKSFGYSWSSVLLVLLIWLPFPRLTLQFVTSADSISLSLITKIRKRPVYLLYVLISETKFILCYDEVPFLFRKLNASDSSKKVWYRSCCSFYIFEKKTTLTEADSRRITSREQACISAKDLTKSSYPQILRTPMLSNKEPTRCA